MPSLSTTLVVMAKAPVPGRVKTRLCPPLSHEQAATLARAALADTLAALAAVDARRVVCLDGDPGDWLPGGFDVVPQRGAGLADRLAAMFEDVGGPAVVVGMDTPQLTTGLLRDAIEQLSYADSVLGPTVDGGYWTIGLRAPDRRVFEGVPMSAGDTGARQRERLHALGLSCAELATLRDVDSIEDARAVAAEVPFGRFATALSSLAV